MTRAQAEKRARTMFGPGAEVWTSHPVQGAYRFRIGVGGFGQVEIRELGRGRSWEEAFAAATGETEGAK